MMRLFEIVVFVVWFVMGCMVLASIVWGDEARSDRWDIDRQSYAVILPTDEPGCEAEVHIFNYETDSARVASGSLWLGDMHVGIVHRLNVGYLGEEQYEVNVPPGYYADPPTIIIADDSSDVVFICQWLGF